MKHNQVLIFISFFWLVSEIILAGMKRAGPTAVRFESASLGLIWITILLSVSAGVYAGIHSPGQLHFRSEIFSICGLILILLGLIIRWIAIFSLHQHFTVDVAVIQNHQLLSTGIYRHIRHPAYSGSLLSFLGLGLSFSNYLSILIIFVPVCAAFLYRIAVEEKYLKAALGDTYLKYLQSTKRLIPGFF